MQHYDVEVFNDMGHLNMIPGTLPMHILEFILAKSLLYLRRATDTDGLGCTFYILKEGLQPTWTYFLGETQVTIYWNVNTFNEKTMKWI
jgi:hypothetical protein